MVDFKTDRVDRRSVAARAEEYRPQLAAYSRALEEITGKPVIRRCLWFFALDQAVDVRRAAGNLKNFSKKQLQFRFSCAILS